MKVPGFEILNRIYEEAPYCVNGVGFGFKKTSGITTSEACIVITSIKKFLQIFFTLPNYYLKL
jgi:hypothetical protein